MQFTGLQQIENTIKVNEHKCKQEIEALKRTLAQKVDQHLSYSLPLIKKDIMGFFQVIAYQEFQEVFYRHYGRNYDVNSLNKSLSFYIDDNLQPHITYNVTNFYIKSDFDNDKRNFNQNANIEGSFDRLMDFEYLDAIEDLDFFGLSIGEDSPYEWATEDVSEIDNRNVFRRTQMKKIFNPKEIYEEAKAKTMESFRMQYTTILKPKLIKKYSIKF